MCSIEFRPYTTVIRPGYVESKSTRMVVTVHLPLHTHTRTRTTPNLPRSTGEVTDYRVSVDGKQHVFGFLKRCRAEKYEFTAAGLNATYRLTFYRLSCGPSVVHVGISRSGFRQIFVRHMPPPPDGKSVVSLSSGLLITTARTKARRTANTRGGWEGGRGVN